MKHPSKESLPIGRAAFARVFCADWIFKHSKIILVSAITFVILCFFLLQSRGHFSSRVDRLETQKVFKAWAADTSKVPEVLATSFKQAPHLNATLGASIAQRLLAVGEVKDARVYATPSLKMSFDLKSPYYDRFSQNSLAIAQGDYEAALEEAKRLKKDLDQDEAFWESRDPYLRSGCALYAYNLVRIASLEKQVGSKEGELRAWEELVRNSGWKEYPMNPKMYDYDAYDSLIKNFTQGDVSLLTYIEQRKNELMKG